MHSYVVDRVVIRLIIYDAILCTYYGILVNNKLVLALRPS